MYGMGNTPGLVVTAIHGHHLSLLIPSLQPELNTTLANLHSILTVLIMSDSTEDASTSTTAPDTSTSTVCEYNDSVT